MEAERETIDRYVAAYLAEHIGDVMPTRITGVQSFGFFAQVEGLGGDGLVPVSTLGNEYFRWDEKTQSLTGEESGTVFQSGMRLELRLVDANPLTGGLAFALPDAAQDKGSGPRGRTGRIRPGGGKGKARESRDDGPPPAGLKRRGNHLVGKRGRPGNIRHQSR